MCNNCRSDVPLASLSWLQRRDGSLFLCILHLFYFQEYSGSVFYNLEAKVASAVHCY